MSISRKKPYLLHYLSPRLSPAGPSCKSLGSRVPRASLPSRCLPDRWAILLYSPSLYPFDGDSCFDPFKSSADSLSGMCRCSCYSHSSFITLSLQKPLQVLAASGSLSCSSSKYTFLKSKAPKLYADLYHVTPIFPETHFQWITSFVLKPTHEIFG